MHESYVVDATYINKTIPTLRLKPDLVGKRLYFWGGGTADDLAVLTHDRTKDSLVVSTFKLRKSGFVPISEEIKKEMKDIINSNALHTNLFIYDMEGKELVYNLGETKYITWFDSYPPQKIVINEQYLVYWNEVSADGKNTDQKVFRLVQDTDNLVGLSNFYNRSGNLILTGVTTDTGLNQSFLLTAHTFGLPLRTSRDTFLHQYCEKHRRGDTKLDPERIHENFQEITLKAIEYEEEKEKTKKELIRGNGKVFSQNYSLIELLSDGVPPAIDAEVCLKDHSQHGFPVKISAANISSGFLTLYVDDDIENYQEAVGIFRKIFDHDRIILVDSADTEYEEYKRWLH